MNQGRSLLAAFLTLFVVAALGGRDASAQATSEIPEGLVQRSVTSGGLVRTYLFRLPNGIAPTEPVGVVLVLHGGGGRGRGMLRLTHFEKVADAHGFVAVFPDGVDRRWNDGRDIAEYAAHRNKVDDVAFLRALVADISAAYRIDQRRIYATGMSNGGLMMHRLACEAGDLVAAIAPVEGRISENTAKACAATIAMPMLIVQGSASPVFEKNSKRFTALGTAEFWAKRNSCGATPARSALPDRDRGDGMITHKVEFSGCRDGSRVTLLEVQGGGHAWPGGYQYQPESMIGKTTRDFDASEEIWAFVKQFRR